MAARRPVRSTGSLERGDCEFIREYASPFAMLVVADLLGVPEEDHATFERELGTDPTGASGSTEHDAMAHSPLEFLYGTFTAYVEDRRRDAAQRRADRARHRDVPGRLDARGDRRRPHRRQPLRRRPGDHRAPPRVRAPAHRRAARTPAAAPPGARSDSQLRRGDAALREPGEGRLPPRAGRRRRSAGSRSRPAHRDGRSTAPPTATPASSWTRRFRPRPGRTPASTSRSGSAPTPARARRSPAPRAASASSGCSTASTTSASRRREHGPPEARRYQYVPTYILRGLRSLHLEFAPVPATVNADLARRKRASRFWRLVLSSVARWPDGRIDSMPHFTKPAEGSWTEHYPELGTGFGLLRGLRLPRGLRARA